MSKGKKHRLLRFYVSARDVVERNPSPSCTIAAEMQHKPFPADGRSQGRRHKRICAMAISIPPVEGIETKIPKQKKHRLRCLLQEENVLWRRFSVVSHPYIQRKSSAIHRISARQTTIPVQRTHGCNGRIVKRLHQL